MKFRDSVFHRILESELTAMGDPAALMAPHFRAVRDFLAGLPESKRGHAYAPGKWTLGQVVGHLADAQLVFLGRILFIARGQEAALPGFDEGLWVETSGHRERSLAEIRQVYERGTALVEAVVSGLPAGALEREGLANGIEIKAAEVLAYMLAHEQHHMRVLRERYL